MDVYRYGGGPIAIRDYDPEWPNLFEAEQARIQHTLGASVVKIEHIGSTAVPGLAAKPIIDLLVGVRSLVEARSSYIEPLKSAGYSYHPEYESFLPNELFFRKAIAGPWTHHVHVLEPLTPRWMDFIVVRDYLRAHPDIAAAYADLKRALALVFGDDIAGFRNGKRPFLQAVSAKAWAECERRSS